MKEQLLELAGGQVYLVSPNWPARSWVLGIHGSGREALSYRDVAFYIRQRDLALQNGCAFAAISMGQDVWARDEGFARIVALYDWMLTHGYRARCVPMATSAGGCQMFRFAQEYPQRVAALVGIFTVWDVEKIHLSSLEKAWGLSGQALTDALQQNNPARRVCRLPNVPIVLCHGVNDQAVPIEEHSLALARLKSVQLHMTDEGHSTQAFGMYDTPLIGRVLRSYVRQEE